MYKSAPPKKNKNVKTITLQAMCSQCARVCVKVCW